MTSPARRLFWAMRPAHMTCAGPGCERAPLCGFLSADGETFFCAACYDDGLDTNLRTHQHGPRHGAPRLRTPEERAAILRCAGEAP